MKKSKVTWITLAVLCSLLLYGCFLVMQPFLSEVFLAIVLTIVFFPLYTYMLSRTGRPTLSAMISTLATALVFLLPVSALGVVLSQEMIHAMNAIGETVGPEGHMVWLDRMMSNASERLGWESGELRQFITSRAQTLGGGIVANAVKSVQGIGTWLFSLMITLVTMFFLFRGGRTILHESKQWVPLPPTIIEALFQETQLQIFANVYGVVAVGIAQGLLTAIGFLMCGLPSPWFWGTVAAALSVLPLFGAAIIWLPGVVYLLITTDFGKAALLAAWGALAISSADNIIRPIVMSEKAQMNTAVMFFALLGGIDAFGLIGLFAGPIVFSLAIAVMKLLRQYSRSIMSNLDEGEVAG